MKKITNLIRAVVFVIIFGILFTVVSAVLRDKRVVGEYNPTTKIKGFYEEEENSLDFVFIGSSQLYAHVAPAVLWEEFGITSYDFAANEQPLWISYYYIKEALKYQKPKAIVLEMFTVYGADYEEEGVNHINLDDLPLSLNKVRAIWDSVPKELRYSYYLDIAKYHSTWSSLDKAKYEASFGNKADIMKGYSGFLFERKYADSALEEVVMQEEYEEIPAKAKEWLYRIIELTKEENVDLIFLKTPNGNADRQKLYNSVEKLAEEENIPFLNLNTVLDGEAHVNILQAKEITLKVGEFLMDKYGRNTQISSEQEELAGEKSDESKGFPKRSERSEGVVESFDLSAAYFNSYYKKCEILSINTFEEYLEHVTDENYLVFLGKNYHTKSDEAQLLILDGGKAVLNTKGTKKDSSVLMEELAVANINVQITVSDDVTIMIDGLDYSMHTNGYNIVVYDKVLGEFVEMVSFDEERDLVMERK